MFKLRVHVPTYSLSSKNYLNALSSRVISVQVTDQANTGKNPVAWSCLYGVEAVRVGCIPVLNVQHILCIGLISAFDTSNFGLIPIL